MKKPCNAGGKFACRPRFSLVILVPGWGNLHKRSGWFLAGFAPHGENDEMHKIHGKMDATACIFTRRVVYYSMLIPCRPLWAASIMTAEVQLKN